MLIPQDFLTSYVRQYSVTTGELEALSAALAGKAIADIAVELGIKPNAVRKRLGEVYQKFDIRGKGPGKLVKLQQLLVNAYQEQTAKKKVALVWSGEAGKQLAQGFQQTIFKHPQIEVILCRQDIAAASWRNDIESSFNRVTLGICCLSNITSAINFNFGFLLGKIKQIKLLQWNQSFPEIFADFSVIEAKERSQLQDLLQELIGQEEAKTWIDYQFPQWQNILRTIAVLNVSSIGEGSWSKITAAIPEAIKALEQNQYIRDNDCFRQIVLHSLAEINHQLETTRTSHVIPASLYPRYLMSLQQRSQIQIKALTLVDRDEDFWQQEMGREIRSSTQSESVRVFVFTTPNIFERNFEILLEHAEKYRVRVISYQKLSQDFPEYCKSFGIITTAQSKLLAEYIERATVKYNRFCVENTEVNQHEKTLTAIIDSAIEVNKPLHLSEPEDILQQMREIRDLVFERSRFAVKSVGISQYLNIENYDQCGHRRDFFQLLVTQMLAIFQQHYSQRSKKLPRILELGAKTGHFTQYLGKIKADIWALELDWVCYKKLEYNLTNYSSEITIEHKDSCAYDPPYQFNYIFSCLGDRHIDLADKEKYLKNIKRNLERGGLLIVGDEFLPPYDNRDSYARQNAVEIYHNHCLESARNQDSQLILLETETFNCAKNNQGDYKLSCEQYEHLLRKMGFAFTKQQVGSSVYEQHGSIFIYKAWLDQ